MKIEAGKYYRTRDGRKVGPMQTYRFVDAGPGKEFIETEGDGRLWGADGVGTHGAYGLDLIAEWADAPDLTAITTPFGLLDDATREALKAHGGPYQFWHWARNEWLIPDNEEPNYATQTVYRVKPQPPAPRELWLRFNQNGDWRECSEDADGARLFREIT